MSDRFGMYSDEINYCDDILVEIEGGFECNIFARVDYIMQSWHFGGFGVRFDNGH